MAILQIRKKSASTWVHIKQGQTVILSDGMFRISNENFELSESSGIDVFSSTERLTPVSEVEVYDDTASGTLETFADGIALTDRLKALEYPFFKSASGGSGASSFQLLGGNGINVSAILGSVGGYFISLDNSVLDNTSGIYQNIAELLSEQPNQTLTERYFVIDASTDPTVASGWAIYELDTKDGTLNGYTLVSKEETSPSVGTGSKFLGLYSSLTALNTAHAATAVSGNYADVDAGVGNDVERYIWDADDNKFVKQGSGVGGGDLEYQTIITSTGTTLDGTQKGLNKVYPFENANAQTVTITTGDYVENDVINIERRGQGTVEIIADTGVRIRGVRDPENRYFINDVNSVVSLLCRGSEEFTIIGNLKRGYTGAPTATLFGTLEPSTTQDVSVVGTGFSDNMVVTVNGNAILNSFTVSSSTSIVLNLTSTGSSGDLISVTMDNGDITVFQDAIVVEVSVTGIQIETTSTSSTWSPTTVANSGSTLTWTVSGDASGIYNANDPTIDLSGNTGTAIINVTSADNLAGLTTCRFTSLDITAANVSNWTAATEIWFFGNFGLNEIVGLQNLTALTTMDLRSNSLDTLGNGTFPLVTSLKCEGNTISSLNLGALVPNATFVSASQGALASVDVTGMSSLSELQVNSIAATSITGLSDCINLSDLLSSSSQLTTLNVSALTLLDNLRVQVSQVNVTSINNILIDLDANGANNGTLNYLSIPNPPTATETTTNDVLNAYNSLVAKGWSITGTTPS